MRRPYNGRQRQSNDARASSFCFPENREPGPPGPRRQKQHLDRAPERECRPMLFCSAPSRGLWERPWFGASFSFRSKHKAALHAYSSFLSRTEIVPAHIFIQGRLVARNVDGRCVMRRLFVRTVFSLCMSILASIHAYGASICWGPVYDPASNTDLYVVSKGTWAQTETEATQLGGNLTTIHSAAENSFIVSNVLQDFTGVGGPNLYDAPLWIGLYDPTGIAGGADGGSGASSQHAANFVWVDGSTDCISQLGGA